MVQVYELKKDQHFKFPYTGINMDMEYLRVKPDGTFIVKKGFKWDGNSPKIKIFGKVFGTTDYPFTRNASCIHDALYNYRKELEELTRSGKPSLSRLDCDLIYTIQMAKEGAPEGITDKHYFAIRLFGWAWWKAS